MLLPLIFNFHFLPKIKSYSVKKSEIIMYLERCCGKHKWLGRPEARLPGVLTDCDRL